MTERMALQEAIAEDRPTIKAVNPTTWIKKTDYREQEFKPSPQAFTTQRAGLLAVLQPLGRNHKIYASKGVFLKKSELLNWLQEEYQQWGVFLDQIGPERMDQPGATGDWSMKDIVAHLTGWNRWLVARLQAAQRSEPEPPPPWPAHLQTEDEINAWINEANRGRSVRAVLDETHQVYQQLLAVVKGLPEDVRIDQVHEREKVFHLVWVDDKRFLAGEFFDHFHDDHEPDIRAWLARVEKHADH